MTVDDSILKPEERAAFMLRSLYAAAGYRQYKMSKFEEYDLYAGNKDFLISDSIITFTDTNGKLMALKPDVTLSIIRNTKDEPGRTQKVYYDENVYRISRGTRRFQEIKQSGLECIGDIGTDELREVIVLAAQSLKKLSPSCILDISHLGILQALLDELGVKPEIEKAVLRGAARKNISEIEAICREAGADKQAAEALMKVAALYGRPEDVLFELERILAGGKAGCALDEFRAILESLSGTPASDILRIDFSVVSDMRYYNGVVFKGFIDGIPGSILSGGQYDGMMRRMDRDAGAIGFAVYLDMLELLGERRGLDV